MLSNKLFNLNLTKNYLYIYYENYNFIFFILFIYLIISSLIIIGSFFFIKKNYYKEKLLAYECGFEPYNDSRNSFDIQFYLIGLFFLIFDLESVYLYPIVYSINFLSLYNFYIIFDFLIELFLSYIYIFKYLNLNKNSKNIF